MNKNEKNQLQFSERLFEGILITLITHQSMSSTHTIPSHGPRCNYVFPPTKDGVAVYAYQNPYFVYYGDWKHGKKHGTGRFQIGPNSYYEGEFCEGEITGSGDRIFENGSRYHGDFLNGEFNGRGVFLDADTGEEYEGEWKDNKRNGSGVLKFADGSTYIGHFVNHKRDGQGEYTDVDGSHYSGEWKNNNIEGHGQMTFANGDSYVGEFKNGLRHGWGTMTWAETGLSFTGEWFEDNSEYHPVEISIANLPPLIPGATLNNVKIVIDGGKGETGRVLRVSIEVGKKNQAATSKSKPASKSSTAKSLKTSNVSIEPKFMVVNPLTNQTFIDLTVENGVAILKDVLIPSDAVNTTYTLHVDDQSEIDPLPPVTGSLVWMASAERSNVKNRQTKKTSPIPSPRSK